MFVVITIQDNVLHEVVGCRTEPAAADSLFLDTLRSSLTNFEDYTPDDIDNILSEGYEKTGNGSICLLDLSNWEPE